MADSCTFSCQYSALRLCAYSCCQLLVFPGLAFSCGSSVNGDREQIAAHSRSLLAVSRQLRLTARARARSRSSLGPRLRQVTVLPRRDRGAATAPRPL